MKSVSHVSSKLNSKYAFYLRDLPVNEPSLFIFNFIPCTARSSFFILTLVHCFRARVRTHPRRRRHRHPDVAFPKSHFKPFRLLNESRWAEDILFPSVFFNNLRRYLSNQPTLDFSSPIDWLPLTAVIRFDFYFLSTPVTLGKVRNGVGNPEGEDTAPCFVPSSTATGRGSDGLIDWLIASKGILRKENSLSGKLQNDKLYTIWNK